jgi:glycosyltransferase involved in cell wall biosynthesis
MRVAMILSTPLPPREGIGFYAWNLAQQLINGGHSVHLITRGHMAPLHCEETDGIEIWQVPFFPVYPYHVHLHNYFVQKLISQLDLDIIHLHSPLVAIPKTRLPILVTIHSPMKTATEHLNDKSILGLLIRLQTPISIRIERKLFSRANRLVAVANSVANVLLDYDIGYEQISIMGNGVNTDLFRPAAKKSQDRPHYILTVGRLAPGKGLDDLIQCARIVLESNPDIRFLIAGSGPLEKSLKLRISALGLESNISLLGQISDRNEMVRLYQNATIILHPSHYEGLPTVILEAMACEKPVIATIVGGIPDLISDGINGVLVNPRSPAALAMAIQNVLKDPGNLGAAALVTIKENYSWQILASKYEDVYQSLVTGKYYNEK